MSGQFSLSKVTSTQASVPSEAHAQGFEQVANQGLAKSAVQNASIALNASLSNGSSVIQTTKVQSSLALA